MAILTNTALDIASGTLVATVALTVQDKTTDLQLTFMEPALLALASAAGRSDWNNSDVLSAATSAVGVAVTAAGPVGA